MKHELRPMVDLSRRIFTLRHIETGEYICLRQDRTEYVACFSDGDSAGQFREEMGLIEHVDLAPMPLSETPFDHYWLDGEMLGRNALTNNGAASYPAG
ncbi:MAG: hypothetical protein H7Z41_10660 [Cytophagales bacterium]|nr:hypothetical protein [Armatimonadota bacterium]